MYSTLFKILSVLFATCVINASCFSQDHPTSMPLEEEQVQAPSYETFEMQEGDTTYVMKKYFLCIYKAGPSRSQEKEELNELQAGHMAHIGGLADNNQACIAGPFAEDGDMRGIIVMSCLLYTSDAADE